MLTEIMKVMFNGDFMRKNPAGTGIQTNDLPTHVFLSKLFPPYGTWPPSVSPCLAPIW